MLLDNEENFLRHLEIIVEKVGICLSSFKIVDQLFYFKNDHFWPKKPNKPILHKTFLVSLFDSII